MEGLGLAMDDLVLDGRVKVNRCIESCTKDAKLKNDDIVDLIDLPVLALLRHPVTACPDDSTRCRLGPFKCILVNL